MGKLDSKLISLTKSLVPGIAGLAQLYYGEPNPGWGSVEMKLREGKNKQALQSAVAGLTGVRLGGHGFGGQKKTEIDLFGVLNPTDFRNAPVPKVVVLTRLAIEGISAVGTFVSQLFRDVVS